MAGFDHISDPEIRELLGESPAAPSLAGAEVPSAGGGDRMMVGDAFTGGSRQDRAMALWSPPLKSVDADILPEKSLVDARVRDTLRNDAFVAGGANLHRDGIVGSMFLLNAKPDATVLGLDDVWEEEFQAEVEAKFTLWAEGEDYWIDAARKNGLTALTRLVIGVNVMAGEVLASVEWGRDPGRPFSTMIQMIDLDRLSTPPEQGYNKRVRGGVLSDIYGAPQGYYIRKAHPSDFLNSESYEWKFVPARKPWGRLQIIHILEQSRPEQTRGISDMVTALKELRITKSFRDIVLQNAVVNATYAAAIESELPSETIFAQLGGGNPSEADVARATTNWATGYLSAVNAYAGSARNLQIDGVKIPHLFPGTKLTLHPAGQGGPLGTDFESSLLRYISSAMGVSYEQLSHDWSQLNYSSGKMATGEIRKGMAARKRLIADRFATSVYRLWLEEAINTGQIASMPRRAPSFYEGLNAAAYTRCDWVGASYGQIDELKETQAAALRVKVGLSTLEIENGRLGQDWRKVLKQKAREKKVAEALGLNLDQADNMMNSVAGKGGQGTNGATQAMVEDIVMAMLEEHRQ